MLDHFLHKKLEERKEKGTMRSLSCYGESIDFLSNDFLGLARLEASNQLKTGSGGSRLISGNSILHEESEKNLAQFYGSESALLMNSGYTANCALFSALPDKHSLVLYDKEIHASVRDGLRMSNCEYQGFVHNDCDDLKRRLERARAKDSSRLVFVAVEALYSMSGEVAPLKSILELCEAYNAHLIVDEAHSGGVFGAEGRGLCAELGISDRVSIRLITFGKAYGHHGALVLGSSLLRSFLINFARPFIYTTALSEHDVAQITQKVDLSKSEELRNQLKSNIVHFRKGIDKEIISHPESPIQILRAPVEQLRVIEQDLKAHQIAAKLILSPTVPEGKECLRIVIHSFNSIDEIDVMVRLLSK